MNKQVFYITTPIYYANGSPHIGHFLTTTAADVLARYHRLIFGKENVFFTTGLDEHGTTVEKAAEKDGYTLNTFQKYVNIRAKEWQDTFDKTNISYDYFARTTNPNHEKFAQAFIKKLINNGDVYKAKYEGKYCNGCEKFLTLSDLNKQGSCPLHRPDQTVTVKEDNYFFKLSKYAPKLKKLIKENTLEIIPENKRTEILARLEKDVQDVSISRPKEKVVWGIEFPTDKNQTVYVWVEALLNYLSSLEINNKQKLWSNSHHFLGKDISWFHNIIWPAMLLSASHPLFQGTFVHSFFLVGGTKISKSKGNVITPQELVTKFGIDGARYLILNNFPYKNDTDVALDELERNYNSDLANGLGNLVSRIASLTEKSGLEFPVHKYSFSPEVDIPLKNYEINKSLEVIWTRIKEMDQLINHKKVWELIGSNKNNDLKKILSFLVNDIRQIAYDLQPFLPDSAEKISKQFGRKKITPAPPLFPRLQTS